jgi:protein-tyrosine phosphatase
MGNICRSPTAEGFFRHHLAQSTLAGKIGVDSAGTHDYHLGNPPDPRAIEAAYRLGVDISGLRARRVRHADFHDYHRIIAMDSDNLRALRQLNREPEGPVIELMMSYAPGNGTSEVPDPYYGGQEDFEYMCALLDQATRGLLHSLERAQARRA